MSRIRYLLGCFQPPSHAVKTSDLQLESRQIKHDAPSHSVDMDTTLGSRGAREEPTSSANASVVTKEAVNAAIDPCQMTALAAGLTGAKNDDAQRSPRAQSGAFSSKIDEGGSNVTASVQSLAAGMLGDSPFLDVDEKTTTTGSFLGTTISPFHSSAAVPFSHRDRHEDIVVVITNSTGGTGTLHLTTEESPGTPSDFSLATSARPISFASIAAQSKGYHQDSSTLSFKQRSESIRSTGRQLARDGPDRQSSAVANAIALPPSPSMQSHPSMQSLSMRLSMPSIASGQLPPAPGDISRHGSGCTAATSSTSTACGTATSSFGSASSGTTLNSGTNTGPVATGGFGDLSCGSVTMPADRNSPPRHLPHPAPSVPLSQRLSVTAQQQEQPQESQQQQLQQPFFGCNFNSLAPGCQGLLPLPGLPREALKQASSSAMDGVSEPLHPADKFLRFTDLEKCWAELRDLSFVGSGASGYVYSGMWCGMPVAVKFMLSGDVGQMHRQQREAALSRLASHPHLVQTYAVAAAQLTAAHFQLDISQRRISCLSNTDLLSTCAAGGNVADLYGTPNLSPSPSTSDAPRQAYVNCVATAASQLLSPCRVATMAGAASPSTPPSAPLSATTAAARLSHEYDIPSPFLPVRSPFAYQEPSPSLGASAGSDEHPLNPATAGPATGTIAAAVANLPRRRSPTSKLAHQQLRNRLSGNLLVARESVSDTINSMPNVTVDEAVGAPWAVFAAHASAAGSRGPSSAWRSPSLCRVRGLATAADAPSTGPPPQQPQQPSPQRVQTQLHPKPVNPRSCAPSPSATRSPRRRPAAMPAQLGNGVALDPNINTMDIEVSAAYQVDGKADSFEMNTTEANELMLFQPVDVLTHMGARPGQWLTVVIMEEMDRGSLHRAIHGGGVFHPTASPLSKRHRVRGMVRTLMEVAQGMAHLHSAGLVHGDLKPANVLLKANARDLRGFIAKVSDFGVTRALAEGATHATVSTSDWGTVIYTAPEVFNGRAGMPSDVFSFGALTWHLTTGQLPHEDINPFAVMLAVSRGELELEWPDTVPKPLRKLGMLCMQHDPAERPTFAEITRALRRLETRMRLHSIGGSLSRSSSSTCASAPPQPASIPSTPAGRGGWGAGGGGRRVNREVMYSLDMTPTPAAAAAAADGPGGW